MNITSKKVIQFYNDHPHFDLNEMNELFVDLITNVLSQTPKDNVDENAITTLLKSIHQKCNTLGTSINDVHISQTRIQSDLNELQRSMIDSIQLKLYASRDECMKEFEKCINASQHSEFEKYQKMAYENHDKLLDKLRIHFNDQFKSTFDSQFKQFSTDINLEISKASQSGDLKNFESTLTQKYDLLYKFILQNNQEFKSQLTKMDITEDISNIKTYFEGQKNSSIKGNIGEGKLETILNGIFPSSNIQNTTGTARAGDFMVNRDGLHSIMFETKDYFHNVPNTEVDKFIRDVEQRNTHGIFLSQSSGIATKEDFRIDMYDNNVMIFVHNVHYSPDKIRLAVVMLDHIVAKLDEFEIKGDTISDDTMKNINAEFKIFVQNKTNAIDCLKRFNKEMLTTLTGMELPELASLLSAKYATNDTTTCKCSICNREFKNAKGLAAHKKYCQTKKPKN
tara:strand:- start:2297 stop:3652 length:1356 start_codon:yes stop_codon:yes gene_type:complete